MSGSIKTFIYEMNNGNKFLYEQDESNSEGCFGSLNDFTAADVGVVTTPLPSSGRFFRPRQAVYVSTAGHVRRVIVPTPAIYADLETQTFAIANISFNETISGTVYQFILNDLIPERLKPRISVDTSLNDGDAT